MRKSDDHSLFLVDVYCEGEDDRPEWGPLEEAWSLDADDFPEDLAGEHGGEVVRFDAEDIQPKEPT